jgi:hypothetical protein
MPNVRPFAAGYATVQALQELNARLDELSARIDRHLGAQSHEELLVEPPVEVRANRPAALRCPQCNKRALRKSRRATMGEKLSLFVLMGPFRCRYCAYFEFRSVFTSSSD